MNGLSNGINNKSDSHHKHKHKDKDKDKHHDKHKHKDKDRDREKHVSSKVSLSVFYSFVEFVFEPLVLPKFGIIVFIGQEQ